MIRGTCLVAGLTTRGSTKPRNRSEISRSHLCRDRGGPRSDSDGYRRRYRLLAASLRDSAAGTLRTEPAQVIKTNSVGQVDVVWSRTFAVKANRNYILRLPYRTEDASLANLLLLRYTRSADDVPKLDAANDGFAMWTGQSLVRNSPPGQWDSRFCTVRADRDGDITVHALLYGNPCTVQFGEPAIEDYKTIRPHSRTTRTGSARKK